MTNLEIDNHSPTLFTLINQYFGVLLAVVMLLVAAGAYYLLFVPQLSRFRVGGDLNIKSRQSLLDSYRNYDEQLKDLKQQYGQIQSEDGFPKLARALPENIDLPGLFVLMEALAQPYGVQIQRIDVSELELNNNNPQATAGTKDALSAAVPNGVKKVIINLTVGALEYGPFKAFLRDIESSVRLLDIISFAYDPRNDSQSINLVTYYFK